MRRFDRQRDRRTGLLPSYRVRNENDGRKRYRNFVELKKKNNNNLFCIKIAYCFRYKMYQVFLFFSPYPMINKKEEEEGTNYQNRYQFKKKFFFLFRSL